MSIGTAFKVLAKLAGVAVGVYQIFKGTSAASPPRKQVPRVPTIRVVRPNTKPSHLPYEDDDDVN